MADVQAAYAALALKAIEWNGELIKDPSLGVGTSADLNHAPFSQFFSVDYLRCKVYYDPDVFQYSSETAGIIHEMGHVFACHDSPLQSEEFDFLGWEWVLAREVGLLSEWCASMRNYSLNSQGDDFGNISIDDQTELIESRVAHACELGLIVDDEPVCIRDVVKGKLDDK